MRLQPDPVPRVVMIDGALLDLEAARIARLVHEMSVGSTMDLAHSLANEGAGSGTVVIADVQHAGRGRSGKSWHSSAGDGLWCTVIVREAPASGLDVLSLRLGLAIAEVVSPWCDGVLGLKWPNDVLLQVAPDSDESRGAEWRKLAGVLVEARWREAQVEWIAIGIGLNLRAPVTDVVGGSLREGVSRAMVLRDLIPRVLDAAKSHGVLSASELERWGTHDMTVGRACAAPDRGVVAGVQSDGALRITMADGSERTHRSGSLIFVAENDRC